MNRYIVAGVATTVVVAAVWIGSQYRKVDLTDLARLNDEKFTERLARTTAKLETQTDLMEMVLTSGRELTPELRKSVVEIGTEIQQLLELSSTISKAIQQNSEVKFGKYYTRRTNADMAHLEREVAELVKKVAKVTT